MIGQSLMRQSTRYMAGGVVCALLHNVIMVATSAYGIPYPPALVLSFLVTAPIGYAIHSAYTFETACSARRLQRFIGGAASGFAVSAALMVLFCSGLGIPVAVATPIATVLVFFWNFALARWAILDLLTPLEGLR